MPTESALGWLSDRFRDYDLIYLDPLLCDPSLRSESPIQRLRHPRKRAVASFLGKLAGALKVAPGDENPTVFLSDKGPGGRLKSDRQLQRSVLALIKRHCENPRLTPRDGIRSLDPAFLREISDQPGGNSLLVLDAMFLGRKAAPKEIQQTTQIAPQLREGGTRESECMLADVPSQLLTLHHPVLPLVTDKQTHSSLWQELALLLEVGWYPYVRAIGLHRTLPGGRPYLDVLALLMRPCPSLSEALEMQGDERKKSLVGALQTVQEDSLEQEIERLRAVVPPKAAPSSEKTPDVPPENATPKESAPETKAPEPETGEQPSTAASHEADAYKPEFYLGISEGEDRDTPNLRYLSPVLMFQLCCKMNHVSGLGLLRREPLAYRALQHYLDRLEELRQILGKLDAKHELMPLPASVDLLLPAAPPELTTASPAPTARPL